MTPGGAHTLQLGPYTVAAWLDWSPAHQLFQGEGELLIYRLLPAAPIAERRLLASAVRQLAEGLSDARARIPQLSGTDLSDDELVIAVEDVPGRRVLRLSRSVAPALALGLASRVLEGLAPLHRRGLFHGALTPSRILLDEQGQPRIYDTGPAFLSDALPEQRLTPTVQGFTQLFPVASLIPPEVFLRRPLSPASDVFLVAALTYRWLTGDAAHGEGRAMEVYARLRDGQRERFPSMPAGLDLAAIRCLNDALEPRPEDRPDPDTLAAALKPFFTIDLSQLASLTGDQPEPHAASFPLMNAADAPGPPGSPAEERRQQALTRASMQLEMMRNRRPSESKRSSRVGLLVTLIVAVVIALLAIPFLNSRPGPDSGPALKPRARPTAPTEPEAPEPETPIPDEPTRVAIATDEPLPPPADMPRRRQPEPEARVVRAGIAGL